MTRARQPGQLTELEVDTIRLLADGLNVQQIAARECVTGTAISMRLNRSAVVLGFDYTTAAGLVAHCLRTGVLVDQDQLEQQRATRRARAVDAVRTVLHERRLGCESEPGGHDTVAEQIVTAIEAANQPIGARA